MSTVNTTTARSSTSVMPIMMRPCREWSSPRSSSRRASTMVLATEITMPMTMPCRSGQPRSPTPSSSPRRADAERAPEEGHPAHPGELAQRELDPDGEHQQDDPDLREQLEGVDVGDGGARGERPDEDPPPRSRGSAAGAAPRPPRRRGRRRRRHRRGRERRSDRSSSLAWPGTRSSTGIPRARSRYDTR